VAQCTAPSRGHRTASAAAECPACSSRGRYNYAGGYGSGYSARPSYGTESSGSARSSGGSSSGGGVRPRWSRASSPVSYTPAQVVSLTPVRATVEWRAAVQPELRDVFLCHAWNNRHGALKAGHGRRSTLDHSNQAQLLRGLRAAKPVWSMRSTACLG
jgi:hypothetical protein